jgi:HK97 family phage prohead protease
MTDRKERTEEVRTFEFRAADSGDGQTLEGYAAVYDTWTDIRDAVGTFRERIMPNAFKRSLGQKTPVMQFDHGQHPLIGSLPIASIKRLREDARGLYVEARVFDNWLTEPLRDAIREEAIKGMSFRFSSVEDSGPHPARSEALRAGAGHLAGLFRYHSGVALIAARHP